MSYKYKHLRLSIGEDTLDIPFFSRDFTFKVTFDCINKTFAEQIKYKKITVTIEEKESEDLICISGIINWDNLPVTDFVLSYKKPPYNHTIFEANATIFTFYGRSKINLEDLQEKTDCKEKCLMQDVDFLKNRLGTRREVLYTHYSNAVKAFICEDNKFSIRLVNMIPILNGYEMKVPNATGLPIYVRKGYWLADYDVSLTNFQTKFLERVDNDHYILKCTAFLTPTFDCAITSATFYTNTLEAYTEHGFAWRKIVLELDGDKAVLSLSNSIRTHYSKMEPLTDTSFTVGNQKIEICPGSPHNTIVITPVT